MTYSVLEITIRVILVAAITVLLSLATLALVQGVFGEITQLALLIGVSALSFFILGKWKEIKSVGITSSFICLLLVALFGIYDIRQGTLYKAVAGQSGQIASSRGYMPAAERNEPNKDKQLAWVEKTKEGIRKILRDPSSVTFRNVQFVWMDKVPMVCGEVNSKNAFGGYTGFQRFVGSGDIAVLLEEQGVDFENVWQKACLP